MAQTMALFTNAGFDVRISELDVRIPDTGGAVELQAQATIYGNIMRACLLNARCTGITTWGFTDKYSWIPGHTPGFGRALPFDNNYAPKPAYTALFEALRDTP
jgi:endo-1,4-beta-xylanase